MARVRIGLCCLVFLLGIGSGMGQAQSGDAGLTGAAIERIQTRAKVSVSDGSSYTVETFYRDPQRAVMKMTYPERQVTIGVEGKYYWNFDGNQEKEGTDFHRLFTLGHQYHALLLFFKEINGSVGESELRDVAGVSCRIQAGKDGYELARDVQTGRAVQLTLKRAGEPDIVSRFSDWRAMEGFADVELPYSVQIVDGARTFDYTYEQIRLNNGSLQEWRTPLEKLSDEQQILRSHRLLMDAHLDESVAGLANEFAEQVEFVNAGELELKTAAETLQGLTQIFSNRDYQVYNDLIRPRVRVSRDGTLGWITVRIEAKGKRLNPDGSEAGPLHFVCAWVATYQKVAGRWKMVGNISNFAADDQ